MTTHCLTLYVCTIYIIALYMHLSLMSLNDVSINISFADLYPFIPFCLFFPLSFVCFFLSKASLSHKRFGCLSPKRCRTKLWHYKAQCCTHCSGCHDTQKNEYNIEFVAPQQFLGPFLLKNKHPNIISPRVPIVFLCLSSALSLVSVGLSICITVIG